ncbi:MAG: SDR family oxidoreductase [Melioribacteraceae bacterium]|nr:SDR family oxidoreductase [Melioribacteraceae bacterium]
MGKSSISIIGCGWLGLPLAEKLIEEGYDVKGSTTTPQKLEILHEKKIEAHQILLNPHLHCSTTEIFFDSNILIINIPPSRNSNVLEFFPQQIKSVMAEINKSKIDYMLFISSTSVYAENNKLVTEDSELDPVTDSGKALVIAEGLIRADINFQTTILRFGGLVGPGRNPARFFAGRKDIPGGNTKINLIHLDDCIDIILTIIKSRLWGEVFNAVSDFHPTKKDFYLKAAEHYNLEKPEFSEVDQDYKIVSSAKIKSIMGNEFVFRKFY